MILSFDDSDDDDDRNNIEKEEASERGRIISLESLLCKIITTTTMPAKAAESSFSGGSDFQIKNIIITSHLTNEAAFYYLIHQEKIW